MESCLGGLRPLRPGRFDRWEGGGGCEGTTRTPPVPPPTARIHHSVAIVIFFFETPLLFYNIFIHTYISLYRYIHSSFSSF